MCGGHIDADETLLTNRQVWDDKSYIDTLFRETAIREANEEFRLLSKPDFRFQEKHLMSFGGPGDFEFGFDDPKAENREYSAFFAAFVPGEVVTLDDSDDPKAFFQVGDSVGIGGREEEAESSKLKLVVISDLILDFIKNPDAYADGIARVLSRVASEAGTMTELVAFLESNYKEVPLTGVTGMTP
jgi:hypothetical protein